MKHILLIDTNIAVLEAIRQTLVQAGNEVLAVGEARQVAAQIRQQSPDLIILDVSLAGADGRSICQLLKNSPQYRTIPILLMSETDIISEDLLVCEADDFLKKPFDMTVLLSKAERLLNPQNSALALAI